MIRRFQQHYYTASKQKGGIFTLDQSSSLSPDEVKELEKKSLYKKPRKLPSEPTDLEIIQLFPANICFYRLDSSRRYVYLHSNYTGRANHTPNRFNNFFSHSLILTDREPDFPAAYILYNTGNFKTSFSIEEDIRYSPGLPEISIDINDAGSDTRYFFDRFTSFILSHKIGEHVLSQILDVIAEKSFSQGGKNITICDHKENLSNWMLAVNFFLPKQLANDLSFASYVSDPAETSFSMTGVIPACDVSGLDPRYFSFIDATKENLLPQKSNSEFGRQLMEIIKGNDYYSWKSFISSTSSFDKRTFITSLNRVNTINSFFQNIAQQSVLQYSEILNTLSGKDRTDFMDRVSRENPSLLGRYFSDQLLKKLHTMRTAEDRVRCFVQLYKEFFEQESPSYRAPMEYFIKAFLDEVHGKEKNAAAFVILANSSVHRFAETQLLDDLVRRADQYIDEASIIKEKLHLAGMIAEKIKDREDIRLELYKNISMPGLMERISTDIPSGFSRLMSYKDAIAEMSFPTRTYFMSQLLYDSLIKPFDGKKVRDYIEIIHHLFEKREADFWGNFFSGRHYSHGNDLKIHSLPYFKKIFISQIFLEKQDESILEMVSITKEEADWILEFISENTADQTISEHFAKVHGFDKRSKKGWFGM